MSNCTTTRQPTMARGSGRMMEMRVEVIKRTHPGSTSEVRKSPAGSSRARGSRWSESVGCVASGLGASGFNFFPRRGPWRGRFDEHIREGNLHKGTWKTYRKWYMNTSARRPHCGKNNWPGKGISWYCRGRGGMLRLNGSDRWTIGISGGSGVLGDDEELEIKLPSNNSGAMSQQRTMMS